MTFKLDSSMSTKNSKLYNIFFVLFSVCFSWMIISVCSSERFVSTKVYIYFLFLYILFVILLNKYKYILKNIKFNYKKIHIFLLCVIFIMSVFVGINLRVGYSWDYGQIHNSAFAFALDGQLENKEYFARYPNNNYIVSILSIIYKSVMFFVPNISEWRLGNIALIFNSLFIVLAINFTSLSVKKLYGDKLAIIGTLIMAIFMPTLLYSSFFYTDTVGLLFVSLLIYLITKKNTINNLILISLVTSIGYGFKAFIIIVFIAFIIDFMIRNNSSIIYKFLSILLMIVVFLLTSLAINMCIDKYLNITKEDYYNYKFPAIHWILMGSMNQDNSGGYHQKIVDYNRKLENYDVRKIWSFEELTNNVNSTKNNEVIKHYITDKTVRTWSDGTMGTYDYTKRNVIQERSLHKIVSSSGDYFSFYIFFSQMFQIYIYMSILLYGVLYIYNGYKNKDVNFMFVSIIGIMILLTIWECNSRYLYSFIPIFVICALSGMKSLITYIDHHHKDSYYKQ